jgi:hypothetical protein
MGNLVQDREKPPARPRAYARQSFTLPHRVAVKVNQCLLGYRLKALMLTTVDLDWTSDDDEASVARNEI